MLLVKKLVLLIEFCHTHGDTYEEALKNAQEVLEMLYLHLIGFPTV
ncbi:MAG: type II toxin-antitoxin system HicB family antitoxin [Actinomycetota bacterium]